MISANWSIIRYDEVPSSIDGEHIALGLIVEDTKTNNIYIIGKQIHSNMLDDIRYLDSTAKVEFATWTDKLLLSILSDSFSGLMQSFYKLREGTFECKNIKLTTPITTTNVSETNIVSEIKSLFASIVGDNIDKHYDSIFISIGIVDNKANLINRIVLDVQH